MSQIKKHSKLFENYQILKELDIELEAQEFLERNLFLFTPLVEIASKIEEFFPESKMVLNLTTQPNESLLTFSIFPDATTIKVLERFSDFKELWWSAKYDQIRAIFALNLEHADFVTSGNPWDSIDNLIGSVEGPEDWASEHDHYLYGTPKLNQ